MDTCIVVDDLDMNEATWYAPQIAPSNRFEVLTLTERPKQRGQTSQGLQQENFALQDSADESGKSINNEAAKIYKETLAVIYLHLRGEIRSMFGVSEANQSAIQASCLALSQKMDHVVALTKVQEEEVAQMKQNKQKNASGISHLSKQNQGLREDLEWVKNDARRNNLRILNFLEMKKEADMKSFIVALL
ncbi:hypothetical protein NDU88_003748 [Pleurodeles waltl]|uniref:Uncharacterized protein n=1 Tax=Pleurodeles waltl TaxID=8319 RepID=A0AAV7TS58_PLEWA|nr:hypothetical protein NDU88_003748 [Pleurodeles waltl]